jgi:hypothetical protein
LSEDQMTVRRAVGDREQSSRPIRRETGDFDVTFPGSDERSVSDAAVGARAAAAASAASATAVEPELPRSRRRCLLAVPDSDSPPQPTIRARLAIMPHRFMLVNPSRARFAVN